MKLIKLAATYILLVGIIFIIFNGFPMGTAEISVENKVSIVTNEDKKTTSAKPDKKSEMVPQQVDNQGDYPFLSNRLINDAEIEKYSENELRLMRNELFAKHGFIFKAADMSKHFSQKKWYRGLYEDSKVVYGKFSDIEKRNIETIQRAEANKGRVKTANGRYIDNASYVDLGLPSKTLWANCNLGAKKPWEYGNYYSWAETKPNKSRFRWDSYTKAHKVKDKNIAGTIEDAATSVLGIHWAIPTNAQKNELLEKCKWEWSKLNGVAGAVVTGPNNKSIFFPAGGSYFDSWKGELKQKDETCFYWTSDCVGNEYDSDRAYCLIMSDGYDKYTDRNGEFCDGKLIRPVYNKQ